MNAARWIVGALLVVFGAMLVRTAYADGPANPTITRASNTPNTPPASDISTVSDSTCRSTRPRLAPSTVRIAISFRRPHVFASVRFATFAHAISSTNATAPIITHNVERALFTSALCIVSTVNP